MNGFSKISPTYFPITCTTGYRFAFNGKENDNEVKGTGNQQDYGFRNYDPRLGRFLSVDPLTKKFPELTPYQFASNTPIWAVDWDGLEARVYTDVKRGGHTFLSVIDDKGVKHVYTYGGYGEGGVLVHLVGKAADKYIRMSLKNMVKGLRYMKFLKRRLIRKKLWSIMQNY
ncbi:MAG: hypothetical protein IPK10_05540 [Bacteroidetes bacterium]|nr:hypothetical protein [Bacteroidota bacterium]